MIVLYIGDLAGGSEAASGNASVPEECLVSRRTNSARPFLQVQKYGLPS